MAKVGVVLLMICAIAVLSYLIFISFKLLRKAESERKAELAQKNPHDQSNQNVKK